MAYRVCVWKLGAKLKSEWMGVSDEHCVCVCVCCVYGWMNVLSILCSSPRVAVDNSANKTKHHSFAACGKLFGKRWCEIECLQLLHIKLDASHPTVVMSKNATAENHTIRWILDDMCLTMNAFVWLSTFVRASKSKLTNICLLVCLCVCDLQK